MSDNTAFEKSMLEAMEQIISHTASAMETACFVVESEAKRNCPVDMGQLRASIASEVKVTEDGITGYVGSNLDYAPYVHNGTGIYALDGSGRKTPWGYEVKAGKYKGFHWTHGQKPNQFLEKAKLAKKDSIERILGGEESGK